MKGKSKKRTALRSVMRSVPEGDMILHYVGAAGPYVKHPSHDRSAAIVGATIIEYALKKAICLHLKPDPNDPNFNYLFDSDEAPYREFAGRLRLAKALGILSQNDFDKLEAIRHIRNAFAHTLSPIDFDTPEVADLLADFESLPPHPTGKTFPTNRMCFSHTLINLYLKLFYYSLPADEPKS